MMAEKKQRHRFTVRDHLTAYLVLMVIVCVILVGVFALFVSGIFDPVEVIGEPLEGTPTLEISTPPPPPGQSTAEPTVIGRVLGLLIPGASAEEAPQSEDELSLLLEQIVSEETEEEQAIPEDQRVTVDREDLSINRNLPADVYNVLLLATDTRGNNIGGGRSDVMIVASFDMSANEIKLTSFSRDLWVSIASPSVGENKLNAAYAFGGPYLSLKTINEVFELNLDDYVVVDFATMAGIIDSIGGVDIYLEGMEYAYINYLVAVGEDYEGFAKSDARRLLTEDDADVTVHLDGLQGVAYARIRKLDSDIRRGSRQRVLLQAIMDKAMSNLSFSTFYSLATNMLNSTSTNIKLTKIIELGNWLLETDSFPALSEMSIPVEGSYRGDTAKDMQMIRFDRAQNVEALHTFIFGEYIPAGDTAP